LSSKLKQLGFIPIILEQGVFINNYKIIIIVYVDDILVIGPNLESIEDIKNRLKSLNLDLEDLGEASYFLGIEININKDNLTLSQEKYCKNILEKYNKLDLIPVLSPTEPGIKLEKSTSLASNLDINNYQQQIGSLIYLATKTRLDISFAVNNCARFMSNPNSTHFKALERI
jgi:hypothetical protein